MANKHMKRWSTLSFFKETPIKITIRYHCIPIKMEDGYQKQKQEGTSVEDVENWNPCMFPLGMYNGAGSQFCKMTMEVSFVVPKSVGYRITT